LLAITVKRLKSLSDRGICSDKRQQKYEITGSSVLSNPVICYLNRVLAGNLIKRECSTWNTLRSAVWNSTACEKRERARLFQQIADLSTAPLAVTLREAPLRMAISGMAASGWIKPLYATLLRGLYVEPA